jgi:hypothetical protein
VLWKRLFTDDAGLLPPQGGLHREMLSLMETLDSFPTAWTIRCPLYPGNPTIVSNASKVPNSGMARHGIMVVESLLCSRSIFTRIF